MLRRTAYFLMVLTLLTSAGLASTIAATLVPQGNRNGKQPPIPAASARRTRISGTDYAEKYRKIYTLLQKDTQLQQKIRKAAATYDIAPVHIAAAIVGEHTYNVSAHDTLQTYYIKGISWAREQVRFSYKGEAVLEFVTRQQFAACQNLGDSYALWTCREMVWDSAFRGKTVDGQAWPDNRFSAVFFQPFYAGQTFGLGQINPLTALKVSDLVNARSGLPKLSAGNGAGLYRTIMDPDKTIAYIAAIIRSDIDTYRQIADMDISQNPGITATLYNLGGAQTRARALAAQNRTRKAQGLALVLPQENYYGWLVNDRRKELEQLFTAP
ncbi:MAG: Hypothetical protein BHV28_01220 [Candidatus Tokpelaia hoelldobleri]|uniref:DUF1402 family protein n=1 Tax=Candidatus Tokpelaia hoelldobleri TaxID=1902579 RepID=A0A1U9JSK6_9HYPH|nr:MAG: Hypothetical protein BHV28_01220 [Candidatus Tokpelaia hoelldoblerii]